MMKWWIICAVWCSLISCSKNDTATRPATCLAATVRYSAPEADGFGWTLDVENHGVVVPVQLPEAFRQSGLPVQVCFRMTGEKAPCRCLQPPPVVEITNIQKR